MITHEQFEALAKELPEFRKNSKKILHDRISLLDRIQSEDVTNGAGPDHTYAAFEAVAGKVEAAHTLACLVNQSAWDGRISPRNAEWARNYPCSFDEQTMTFEIGEYTRMHKCHLDQIADYARKAN